MLEPIATLKGHHKGAVNTCRFNTDGAYVLTAGDDKRVLLWNPRREGELAPIKSYEGHGQRIQDVCVAQDNASFASCGGDRTVFVWDVASGRITRRLAGHEQRVNAVAYNRECSILLSASYDKTVRCWDLRSRSAAPVQVLADGADSVSSVATSAHQVLAGGIDGAVRTYDLRAGTLTTDTVGQPVTHVALSGDGNCILAASLDARLRLLDLASGEKLAEYGGHKNGSYKLACCFSFDDATVVSGSEDGAVHVWDLVEAKQRLRLPAHRAATVGLAYHPTKHELLTASHDGACHLWALPGG